MCKLDEKRTIRLLLALLNENKIDKAKDILLEELKEDNKQISKFNEIQIVHLESFFTVLIKKLEGLQSINKVLKESIIDVHGEQNKNISIHNIEFTLNSIDNIIDPINTELSELSSNANYIFWNKSSRDSFSIWNKIEDNIKVELGKLERV